MCFYLVEARSVLCTIQGEGTNAASNSESCEPEERIYL